MPYSARTFDEKIRKFILENPPKLVLDIGAGAGKYGEMFKTLSLKDNVVVDAVEVDESYIKDFKLETKYNKIYNDSIVSLIKNGSIMDNFFDTVIMGDVLEHLTKSEGTDVINALSFMTNNLIIVVPLNAAQYACGGHESERHKARWDIIDFMPFAEFVREIDKSTKDMMLYARLYFNCWRVKK